MNDQQPIVYCWRYENQSVCKIGKSLFNKFYDICLKPAQRNSILDIEVLGICLCDSIADRDKLEVHLLNERFDRVRSDREFVHYNSKVRDWIQQECLENSLTVEFFQRLDNEYKPKHRRRSRESQRKKRWEKYLKTRARNLYCKWAAKPESPLCIGGPALARAIVAEDLAEHGVEASLIQEWLDDLESTC